MRIRGTRQEIIPGSRWIFLEDHSLQGENVPELMIILLVQWMTGIS